MRYVERVCCSTPRGSGGGGGGGGSSAGRRVSGAAATLDSVFGGVVAGATGGGCGGALGGGGSAAARLAHARALHRAVCEALLEAQLHLQLAHDELTALCGASGAAGTARRRGQQPPHTSDTIGGTLAARLAALCDTAGTLDTEDDFSAKVRARRQPPCNHVCI